MRYRRGLPLAYQSSAGQLGRLGNHGLSELVRSLLAILSKLLSKHHHHEHLPRPLKNAVYNIKCILKSIFPEPPTENPHIRLYPKSSDDRPVALDNFPMPILWNGNPEIFTSCGSVHWHQLILRTSSSELHHEGPFLFGMPVRQHSRLPAPGIWVTREKYYEGTRDQRSRRTPALEALASTYVEEGNYNYVL